MGGGFRTRYRSPDELRKNLIRPGISQATFQAIRKKAVHMKSQERICALLFLEIDLEARTYPRNDGFVLGLEDYGWERTDKTANHATVFMLRSVYGRWKQPVAFAFHEGDMALGMFVRFLAEIKQESKSAGLTVVAMVCTDTLRNMNACCVLRASVRENQDVTFQNRSENLPIFDAGTMLLKLRDHFMRSDIEIKRDGVWKVASWDHVRIAYQIDTELSHHLTKVTRDHVYPPPEKLLDLSLCMPIFSSTLSGFLTTAAGKSDIKASVGLPSGAIETAEFLSLLDRVFDSVNCSSNYDDPHKPLRRLASKDSAHCKFWEEMSGLFGTYANIDRNSDDVMLLLQGFSTCMMHFEMLRGRLEALGQDEFPCRSFNLDPLRNIYDAMQEWADKNDRDLDCKAFSLFYNMCMQDRNCGRYRATEPTREADDLPFLVSIDDFA